MKKLVDVIADVNVALVSLYQKEEYVVDVYAVELMLHRAMKEVYPCENIYLNNKGIEIKLNNNINYQDIGLNLKVKKKKIEGYRRYNEAKMAIIGLEVDYDRDGYVNMEIKELDDLVKAKAENAIDAKANRIENEANEYIALIEKYGINEEDLKKLVGIRDNYKYDVKGKVQDKLGYYL